MEFESSKQGEKVVVKVSGRMDAVTAPEFESECEAWLQKGEKHLVIDLGGLEYISSAGLRSILTTAKKLKEQQGSIAFCHLTGMVQEVFTISGFASMFSLCESVEQALEK